MGKSCRTGEQKHVMSLKPLFSTHTLTSLPTFCWLKQVTWPNPKSVDEDDIPPTARLCRRCRMNYFITVRERIVGNNNQVYHNISIIVLIDFIQQ